MVNSSVVSETDKKSAQLILNKCGEGEKKDKTWYESLYSNIGSTFNDLLGNILNIPSAIISAVVDFLSLIIRALTSLVIWVLWKILYIVGPLAIVMSMIPLFKDQFTIWLQAYLSCGFAFVTFNLLDYINIELWRVFIASPNLYHGDIYTFKIGMLIAYSMVLWLTGKYVGKSDVSRYVGKGLNFAVDAASLMVGTKLISSGFNGNKYLGGINKAVESSRKKINTEE